jgi:hypothetical protein
MIYWTIGSPADETQCKGRRMQEEEQEQQEEGEEEKGCREAGEA